MRNVFLLCLLLLIASCEQKEKHLIKIQEGSGILISSPVYIDVSQLEMETFKLTNKGEPIAFEYDSITRQIWFVHQVDRSLEYTLEEADNTLNDSPRLTARKNDGNIELAIDNNAVAQYRYGMNYPDIEAIFEKEGVPIPEREVPLDSIFRKSGYLHPIMTPKGDTLTRINPIDHLHHYGLWGPWTHTRIDTTRVDFWNLGEGMGTVLFKEFQTTTSGNAFTGFVASQEHLDYKTKKEPQVALNEDLEVRLWNLGDSKRYMLDYKSSFSSPLQHGILFEAYRYGGGIGLRFDERWKADNCSVLTSEGHDRLSADGTKARWCIVSGESSDGLSTSGILFMSHPENRMHPEPMRIWPIDANGGRGDMFFEFCPIRYDEWKIEPNMQYGLNYRMVIFDGELSVQEAEAYWQAFASQKGIIINSD